MAPEGDGRPCACHGAAGQLHPAAEPAATRHGHPEPERLSGSGAGYSACLAGKIVMKLASWLGLRREALGPRPRRAVQPRGLGRRAGRLAGGEFGWGWAGPLAGLVIAAVAVKEDRETWRGDACCGPAGGGS